MWYWKRGSANRGNRERGFKAEYEVELVMRYYVLVTCGLLHLLCVDCQARLLGRVDHGRELEPRFKGWRVLDTLGVCQEEQANGVGECGLVSEQQAEIAVRVLAAAGSKLGQGLDLLWGCRFVYDASASPEARVDECLKVEPCHNTKVARSPFKHLIQVCVLLCFGLYNPSIGEDDFIVHDLVTCEPEPWDEPLNVVSKCVPRIRSSISSIKLMPYPVPNHKLTLGKPRQNKYHD
jgi:hypothetical protein